MKRKTLLQILFLTDKTIYHGPSPSPSSTRLITPNTQGEVLGLLMLISTLVLVKFVDTKIISQNNVDADINCRCFYRTLTSYQFPQGTYMFEETRSILEPSGALAVAGAEAYCKYYGVKGENVVAVTSGANMNFDRLKSILTQLDNVGATKLELAPKLEAVPRR